MFGKIKAIEENLVTLENTAEKMEVNYVNYHIVFEENDHKIVAEVIGSTPPFFNSL